VGFVIVLIFLFIFTVLCYPPRLDFHHPFDQILNLALKFLFTEGQSLDLNYVEGSSTSGHGLGRLLLVWTQNELILTLRAKFTAIIELFKA